MLGKFVAGEGNTEADLFFVGEGPGRMEAALGRPFMGPAGQDLNRLLLTLCGLKREDVWITNLVRWRTDEDNRDPNSDEIARDEHFLLNELEFIKPTIVVPVGAVATRYFLGPDTDMEHVYGLPQRSERWPGVVLFPVYHPAAGLHQADRFSQLVYNSFKQLGKYLKGEVRRVIDQHPYPEYEETFWPSKPYPPRPVAIDTEGIPSRPWGLSYSWYPGDAHVVGYDAGKNFETNCYDKVIFHNALWDLPVLRSMGVHIPYDKLEDTMIQAHLLCVEPKRLKALAYRHAGMVMEEYQDVIKEADDKISKTYLEKAFSFKCDTCKGEGEVSRPWKKNPNKFTKEKCSTCVGDGTSWPRPRPRLVFNDDFTAKIYTPQGIGRRLKTGLAGVSGFRKRWEDWDRDLRAPVEAEIGPMPEVTLDDIEPRSRAINYSARDADATLRVYNAFRPRIHSMDLEKAYEIDKGIIPIIDRMHQNGILINKEYFYDLDKKFEKEQYKALEDLHSELGLYFNPSSPVQVKKELSKLGIKDLESTDERTLKLMLLNAKNEKVSKVTKLCLEYRELSKMRSTYTGPLPEKADDSSRIHTTFIITGPATNRLASKNPNLQNIPTATPRGNSIRGGFIAKPGCKLLSVDLSQIELRVGAHLANEVNMIAAFESGKDLHTLTASKMFGVPYDQVDPKKHRYPAKTISFGVFYGMSKYRLQGELAIEGLVISLEEAQAFIDAWFAAYPGIKPYMHRVQAEARQNSYVRTMFGHIRYVPNVHCKDDRIREEALRQAGNHPVQGTSGEILKIAMANIHSRIYPELNRIGYFEPLLTIHDELVFEIHETLAELASAMVSYEMENAVKLLVPLTSSYKIADNWSELK